MKQILVALLLIAPSAAFARIGETLDDCRARYGAETFTDTNGVSVFHKNGLMVIARFSSNRVAQITYGMLDDSPVSPEKAQALLRLNANEDWQREESHHEGMTQWRAPHAHLVAAVTSESVSILTEQWAQARGAQEIRAKDAALQKDLSGM
jgi:hypothetical protein